LLKSSKGFWLSFYQAMGKKRRQLKEGEEPAEELVSPNTVSRTWGTVGIDPSIVELCDRFDIADMHAKRLDSLLQKREETFTQDIIRLWTDLEEARSPNGLVVALMNQMQEGTFVGQCKPDKELKKLLGKYNLDKEAQKRLSDNICRHPQEKREKYYEELEAHLTASHKPSAAAMMLLRKIKDGEPLGMPGKGGGGGNSHGQADRGSKGAGKESKGLAKDSVADKERRYSESTRCGLAKDSGAADRERSPRRFPKDGALFGGSSGRGRDDYYFDRTTGRDDRDYRYK